MLATVVLAASGGLQPQQPLSVVTAVQAVRHRLQRGLAALAAQAARQRAASMQLVVTAATVAPITLWVAWPAPVALAAAQRCLVPRPTMRSAVMVALAATAVSAGLAAVVVAPLRRVQR
jgi:hypothetical protein